MKKIKITITVLSVINYSVILIAALRGELWLITPFLWLAFFVVINIYARKILSRIEYAKNRYLFAHKYKCNQLYL